MTSFLFRAGAGVPGDINDLQNSVIESAIFDPDNMPTAFGVPVKMVAGKIGAIESGDTAADFYGILTRSAPSVEGDLSSSFLVGTPNENTVCGVAVGGPAYILVTCRTGTPVRGGPVYMRVTDDSPQLVGDLDADADGIANVLLTNVVWAVDGKDSSNVTAVRIK